MAERRKQPFIYVTWLKNYLIGDDLCRWSIWHRIYHYYEEAKSDFNRVQWSMEHATLRNEIQEQYIAAGYEVTPELDVTISGQVAKLKGRIDLVAIREDKNLIIEIKTGKPRESDKIQLMLYIWALPKTYGKFRGASFDGLIVYKTHEIEISAIEVDEIFVRNFKQFTTDILSAEPDRKYPSPRECKWCRIGNCDERMDSVEVEEKSDYSPDFF
jgi:CRISPR-associated protein Cas4